LAKAVAGLRRKGYRVGGAELTRVPAGYPKDHPRADLLRFKTLTTAIDLGCPDWLSTSRAKAEVIARWKAMTPLIAWLDTHVGRD
jgi:hypothetical protein